MGAASSRQAKYALYDKIEEISNGQIHRVDSPKSEYFPGLVAVISKSFAGTETTSTEGISDWIFCGNERRGKHSQILGETPSKERVANFEWQTKFLAIRALHHGGCFVMVEPGTKKVVAAAVAYPPSDKKIYKDNFFTDFWAILKVGTPLYSSEAHKRVDAFTKALSSLHEAAAGGKHWYILNFATDPSLQGKGYGMRLLQFFNQLADADKVILYLETVGNKNIGFYSKAGYTVHSSKVIECKEGILDDDGGVTAMVRQPKEK